jgi:hypothetical protein
MDSPDRNSLEGELERLRQALDAETERCLQVQKGLEQANANFEEFVSIAAHHLRESLRDAAANSQLITETYAGRLDADADLCLSHIRDGVARMQSLLTDMVEYGVIDAGDRQPSRTDMEAVLLLSMDNRLKEAGATVTHDPLPAVSGDSEMLTKVLKHLIRNAVEYCGTPHPRVHISFKRENLECVFSVKDNGPGIDPAFHDRIFSVCTENNTPGPDSDSPSVRRPSSGMAGESGWNRHPGRGRRSTSLFLRLIQISNATPEQEQIPHLPCRYCISVRNNAYSASLHQSPHPPGWRDFRLDPLLQVLLEKV